MELNHILLGLGVIVAITIVAYFLTRPKYYKESTVYLYFETNVGSKHDRVIFIEDGYNDPGDLLWEIEEKRKDVEKIAGENSSAVLKNIRIFKPQWKRS